MRSPYLTGGPKYRIICPILFISAVIRGEPGTASAFPDDFKRGTVIPTKRSLGFTTILDALAAGIHFAGITIKVETVDGRRMGPHYFLTHDLVHAILQLKNEQSIFSGKPGDNEFGPAPKELDFEQKIQFREALKTFNFSHSPHEAKLMEAIVFDVLHEEQLPLHPFYIVSFLKTHFTQPTLMLQLFAERLNNRSDLGQAFEAAPSQAEVMAASKALVAFLQAR